MVKIKEISISKKFSLGNYQMLDIGLVATIEEQDDQKIDFTTKQLYAEIERIGQDIRNLHAI